MRRRPQSQWGKSISNKTQQVSVQSMCGTRTRLACAIAGAMPRIEPLECRRLLSAAVTGSVTLDESAGLQTGGVAVPGEDNNDSDIALNQLPTTLSNRLFGAPAAGLGLSNAFPTAIGVGKSADNFITVTATGTVTSIGFTKTDGSALPVYAGIATGGVSSGLSAVTGGTISLFADASLGSRMVLGVDTTNQISLAMFMDPNATLTSAKIWMVQFEPLANPDATNFDDPVTLGGLGVAAGSTIKFDFDELHSGSNLFGCVGDVTNSLIVIAEKPKLKANGTLDTAGQAVKTSQGGTGATIGIDSQMIDPGEGAFFTYVKGSDPNFLAANLSQGEADNSASIKYSNGTLMASSASVTISQTQGPTPGTMQISCFDVAGSPQQRPFVDGIIDGTGIGAALAVTSITIRKANGTTVTENAGGPNTSANISFAGGVATVSGLGSGDRIEWTTSAPHDRVLIKGVAGKFDVGAFGVNEPSAHLAPLTGVRFEDDGLSIQGRSELVSLVVDETNLGADHTVQFNTTSNFTATFGVDGPASTTFTFGLVTPNSTTTLVDTATGLSVFLFKEGAQVVGRAGADLAAAASGPIVLTVSVDSNGNVTLDQRRAVVHANAADPNDSTTFTISNLLVVTGTATDKDGDSVSQSVSNDVSLLIRDDGPSIQATAGGPTLTVDESDLATNDTDAFALQFTPTFGADGQGATPLSYAISTPGGDSGLDDTATGLSVFLFNESGKVVGRAGANATAAASGPVVFEVSVNSSGNVTLDQKRSIIHPNASDPDDSKTLSSAGLVVLTATATDKDGDSASTPLNIGLQLVMKDDAPTIGPIANSIVDFIAGSSATKSLNGVVGADPKTGPYTVDSFTSSITVNGTELHGIVSGNNTIVTYYADTSGNGTFGDAGDTAFYKLELNQTANSGAGSYTFTVLVNPPPANTSFNFDDLPSGQNLFGMIGDPGSGLVVIGKLPVLKADGTYANSSNTINTSHGGGSTTIGVNNQMFDPGEGAYFTFVKNPNPDFLGTNLSSTEADDAHNILYTGGTLETDNGFLKVVQRQGNGALKMRLSAFNIAGSPQGTSFVSTMTGVKPAVNITEVKVNGVVVFSGSAASVEINIAAGATVSWKTAGLHDTVLVEGVAGKFDIGGFGTTQGAPTPDQKLDFVVKVTDGDGDTNTAGFSIGIDGTGVNDDGIVDGVSVSLRIASSLFSSEPIDELEALLA